MKSEITTEERVWSVLAHLSVLALGMGILLPVVGWAEQRHKSKYAAFHSLQALGYQSLGYTVWFLGYLLLMVLLIVFMTVFIALTGEESSDLAAYSIIGFNIFLFIFIFAGLGIYFLFPVIAAISCAMGRDFRYPLMGNRLATYLEYSSENEGPLNDDHEDRWVAAMGHFGVIIALWGMLAPLTAWILQGRRSLWLKLQSTQAFIFQGCVLLLAVRAGALYVFGFFVFIVLTGFGENSAMNSSSGIIGLAVMLGSMLIALLIVLVVPLFHIMGQWAGYRVLKGDNYLYPIIGKMIERRLK